MLISECFDSNVAREGVATAHPAHFGWIPSGGLFASALADFAAAVANPYCGMAFSSPGAVRMEKDLVDWMAGLIGYDTKTASGCLVQIQVKNACLRYTTTLLVLQTPGGSIANLIAVAAARDARGVIFDQDQDRMVIYVGENAHNSMRRAFKSAGLSRLLLQSVRTDGRYRMDLADLRQKIKRDKSLERIPFFLVGSAGTTDAGAVDPLAELADIAKEEEMWFHVDAAYGGFFLLVEEIRGKFRGIERSDSVTMDPHKALFLPYGTGAIIAREGWRLAESNTLSSPSNSSSNNDNRRSTEAEASYLKDAYVDVRF